MIVSKQIEQDVFQMRFLSVNCLLTTLKSILLYFPILSIYFW